MAKEEEEEAGVWKWIEINTQALTPAVPY